MKRDVTYFIRVKTLENKVLTFKNVKSFNVVDGMIRFTDTKTNKTRHFSIENCEIEEVKNQW